MDRSVGVEIDQFDVKDATPEQAEAFTVVLNSTQVEANPEDPITPFEAIVAGWARQPSFFRQLVWIARLPGGQPAGYARANLRDDQNRHLVAADIKVIAGHRRQDVGGDLLARLAEVAKAEDRDVLAGYTVDRIPAGEDFCREIGAEAVLDVHTNRLVLSDLDRDLVADWLKLGPERAPDYSLVGYYNELPEELFGPLAELMAVMNDAPRGALDVEDNLRSADELKEELRMFEADGSELWWLLARHDPSGELAGFTEVTWSPHRPTTISQGDTGVRPAHRGRALGKWLKAAMIERILERRPGALDIRTNNADANAAMLAINDQLGFRPYTSLTNWQVSLERVQAYLTGL